MKRLLCVLLAIAICFAFSGCGISFTAKKTIGESGIYSERDIEKAMDIVYRKFAFDFEGCALLEIRYDEIHSLPSAAGWAEQYDADEAIVLLSDFFVFGKGDGSLKVGETYKNWKWILVRDKGGFWELKTWGYG